MALIGIILLIGIVKKNAIMMIDFALEAERTDGSRPAEAIYEACLLRFRPIMMTTLAALVRRATAGGRRAAWERAAPPARHRDRRRPDRQPGAHALHDAGDLPLPRPPAPGGSRVADGRCTAPRSRPGRRCEATMRRAPCPPRPRRGAAAAGCTVGPNYVKPALPPQARPPSRHLQGSGRVEDRAAADDVLRGPWWEIVRRSRAERPRGAGGRGEPEPAAAEAHFRQARALVWRPAPASTPGGAPASPHARPQCAHPGVGALGSVSSDFTLPVASPGSSTSGDDSPHTSSPRRRARRRAAADRRSRASACSPSWRWTTSSCAPSTRRSSSWTTRSWLREGARADAEPLDGGIASGPTSRQAQTQLESTRAQAIDLGVQRAALEHAIAVLIGKPRRRRSRSPAEPLAEAAVRSGRRAVGPAGAAPGRRLRRAQRRRRERADRRRPPPTIRPSR